MRASRTAEHEIQRMAMPEWRTATTTASVHLPPVASERVSGRFLDLSRTRRSISRLAGVVLQAVDQAVLLVRYRASLIWFTIK